MGDREREQARGKDKKRTYYVQTPHLVLAKCENLYQLALWTVIKMIAGEKGTCTLGTADLAVLAMMSAGRCQQAREGLLRLGLIEGRLYRDEGYSRAVWHLRIPDMWAENLAWRKRHQSLLERVALKRAQRKGTPDALDTEPEGQNAPDKSNHLQDKGQPSPGNGQHSHGDGQHSHGERPQSRGERQRSPDESQDAQSEVQHSPGEHPQAQREVQHSRGERQRSPGEPKKNPKEEPHKESQEEPKGSSFPSLERIWRCALDELEMQMTRAAFARWVAPLEWVDLERREDGTLVAEIWCPDEYVREWCAARLDVQIRRVVEGIAEQEVEMVYVVDDT